MRHLPPSRPSHRRRAAAAMAVVAASLSVGTTAAAQAGCPEALITARGEAAATKVDARSGAALPFPGLYSSVILDTVPQTTYNQSGPYSLGQLEDGSGQGTDPDTLVPTIYGAFPYIEGSPYNPDPNEDFPEPPEFPEAVPNLPGPPISGRAEAAYPPLEGIPQDAHSDSGEPGSAEAHAYPTWTSGKASARSAEGLDSNSAFTYADVECGVVTMVLGWTGAGLEAPDGTTTSSVGQTVIATISADGAAATVETTGGSQDTGANQNPLQPASDGFAENGMRVQMIEPEITVEEGRVTIEGGGMSVGTTDPSRNDTYTYYTFGSMAGVLEYHGMLPEPLPPSDGADEEGTVAATPPPSAPASQGGTGRTGATTVTSVDSVGSAPEPSSAAQQFTIREVELAGVTEDYTTGSYPLLPLVAGFLAIVAVGFAGWKTADLGRSMFPTGGFAVDWLRDRGAKFGTSYLKW